jgi:hypothetical protein
VIFILKNCTSATFNKKSAPVLPTPELIRLPGKPINHLEQVHFIIFPVKFQPTGHFYAHFLGG